MLKAIKLLLLSSIFASSVANAGYLCSYTTQITDSHKYNTNGVPLQNVAAIIQQERADFYNGMHTYGSGDCYFGKKANRMKIAKMLSKGSIPPRLAKQIVFGNPYIRVDIYTTHIEVIGN